MGSDVGVQLRGQGGGPCGPAASLTAEGDTVAEQRTSTSRLERAADVGRSPDDLAGGAQLTRAELHALQRSEPLSPAQFKELRLLAEQGVSPLRHL